MFFFNYVFVKSKLQKNDKTLDTKLVPYKPQSEVNNTETVNGTSKQNPFTKLYLN